MSPIEEILSRWQDWAPLALGLLVAVLLIALVRRPAVPPEMLAAFSALRDQQAMLGGRLDQLGRDQQAQAMAITAQETALADRLAAQQLALSSAVDTLNERINARLSSASEATLESLAKVGERLAVIDAAQATITALSEQVTGLSNLLGNKQARGAFGEAQLEALVRDVLAPSDYEFQCVLSNTTRVDCLLRLADPPGPIAVDSKFPLEAFRRLRDAANEAERAVAARQFRSDVGKHVKDVGSKYIIANETADSALLFVPSEAIYATLHAEFEDVIDAAFKARVWIVSPTTMMAILNTMQAVMRDVRMRKEARTIQVEVTKLAADVGRLAERVSNLRRHFEQAQKDIDQIEISAGAVSRRAQQIVAVEFDDPPPALPKAP
ncbi:DNA recombination protein RmuC [Elioraea rosea]|uniref:DNA recombination protein RmuC n=1 Tax=Elioraea rosea TaxID=2492390 RepID=UPI001EF4EDD8|nr:DNA recombination protein RmuC [Elioraea rosea]